MFKLLKKISIFTSLCLITLVALQYLETTTKPELSPAQTKPTLTRTTPPKQTTVFAALPDNSSNIVTSVKTADARAEILRQYLAKYQSPLEPFANLIVEISDTYDFDYRWMVAIAQQESSLCKKIPENSYNCWGWGIYPDPGNPKVLKVTRFASYEDAIKRIAPQFKDIFLSDSHTKDPYKVMETYTPPSDGSWADGINYFFSQLQ